MSSEIEGERIALTRVEFDIAGRSITLEAGDKPIARLTFSSGTIYFQTPALSLSGDAISTAELPGGIPSPDDAPVAEDRTIDAEVSQERERPVVLSGRLKSKPREGRPDGRGNPTAWARLAAHEDGDEKARLYSTTFHRHTARIALGLDLNAPITVQAYRHLYDDPERMDTLSVINIVAYPGKALAPQNND
jgi:hypothetical protein